MPTEQVNRILFWTIIAIAGLSVWLVRSAQKFGEKLAGEAKAKKSAKSASSLPARQLLRRQAMAGGRGVPTKGRGRHGNLKPKRKEAK